MAVIAESEVLYKQVSARTIGWGRELRVFEVTFPNAGGGTDYPAAGVPLTRGKLGFPNFIASLKIIARVLKAGETMPEWIWDGNNTTPKLLAFGTSTAAKQQQQISTGGDTVLVIATPQVLTMEVSGW